MQLGRAEMFLAQRVGVLWGQSWGAEGLLLGQQQVAVEEESCHLME